MPVAESVSGVLEATVLVAPSEPTGGVYLTVSDPEAFPDPDNDGQFSVSIYASGALGYGTDAEIVTVRSRNVSGWEVLRAQEGSTARAIAVGDRVQFRPSVSSRPAFGQSVLYANNSDVSVVSSSADTAILSYTVPGNLLGTEGAIRVDLSAMYKNNTGSSKNLSFKVTYGGTTSYLGVLSMSSDSDYRAVDAHLVFGSNGSTSAQKLSGLFGMGNDTGPTTGTGALGGLSGAYPFVGIDPGKDSTVDQTLAVWVKHSAADASLEFTKLFGYLTRVAY